MTFATSVYYCRLSLIIFTEAFLHCMHIWKLHLHRFEKFRWATSDKIVARPQQVASRIHAGVHLGLTDISRHRRQVPSTPQGLQGSQPPIFDLQGSSCVDDPPPNILTFFFIFFPSGELLNTASRCHFHMQCAQCTVFNSTVEHES